MSPSAKCISLLVVIMNIHLKQQKTLRLFAVTFPYPFQSIQITNCTLTCSDLSVISTF